MYEEDEEEDSAYSDYSESEDEEEDESYYETNTTKKKKKPVKRTGKLIFNVLYTRYDVIRDVGLNYNFRLTEDEDEDWDIMWCDGGVVPEKLAKMKLY